MIRIGTLVANPASAPAYIHAMLPHGFESFQLTFWQELGDISLPELAREVNAVLKGTPAVISSLAVFGNPLGDRPIDQRTRDAIAAAVQHAPLFGTDLVCGFTGRIRGKPVPDSIEAFRNYWQPVAQTAAGHGVRIAFENCPMGGSWVEGDWNIAFNPSAWRLMFAALPEANVGLEWEPCHQIGQLIDPLPQLREWLPRIFHLHGKDATLHRDVLNRHGIIGPEPYYHHRHPGFGDTNWTDLISLLRLGNYRGTIDIEGWHDPVYKDVIETTGQVHALHYLKQCRGGDFVPNP